MVGDDGWTRGSVCNDECRVCIVYPIEQRTNNHSTRYQTTHLHVQSIHELALMNHLQGMHVDRSMKE